MILGVILLLFAQAYSDLKLPEYMNHIINVLADISTVDKTAEILKYGGVMLAYSLAATAISVGVGYLAARIGSGLSRDLRLGVFQTVSNFSAAESDKFTVSSLITRSTNDISQIQMFTVMFLRMVAYAPVMAVGGIVKAVGVSAGMSSLVWVVGGAVNVIVVAIVAILFVVQPKFLKLQKLMDRLNGVARDGLNGMMVIRAFNTDRYEQTRFDGVNRDLAKTDLFANRVMGFLFPVINLVMNAISVATVWVAAYTAGDVASVGAMMAFMSYALQIVSSFMMLTMLLILAPRAMVSIKRVREVLNQNISVYTGAGAIEAGRLTGEVRFEHVGFRYPGAEADVLTDVSFTARPGETTAVIGATGAGKSTLAALLPRLYDVTQGRITIDGTDIRAFTLESLRDNIAFVPQKSVLFSGSIADNITYADQRAADREARMKRSAFIAQAEPFIEEKEDGFDSRVAQGGGNVSGGQKQRLSIARALYKNAPILVFDDSFSALDYKTDANLRASMAKHLANTNTLIIAQRVGTILNADRIIVLEQGKIAGMGTHRQLLESCPVYRDIAYSQLSREELEA
ncbi:MAG: ABC transporter ATP-binding protein/permease [Clostridiales bacterium]|jgi:ATP-binding cassette subfamily B protein|nr:ABC transporter ATP-binding protein/permease [Clostridiales bacterium]